MQRAKSARYGERAIRNYIISHTETVSDLLEVLLLQRKPACCARTATTAMRWT
jgi:phosphoenolpyruvate carboxylase